MNIVFYCSIKMIKLFSIDPKSQMRTKVNSDFLFEKTSKNDFKLIQNDNYSDYSTLFNF